MENWQISYLVILIIGLLVGWYFAPFLGVAFIWGSIVIYEVRYYLEEVKKFESESEGD